LSRRVQHLIEVAGEVAHWEISLANLEPAHAALGVGAQRPSLRLRRAEDRLAQFVVLALEHGKLFFQQRYGLILAGTRRAGIPTSAGLRQEGCQSANRPGSPLPLRRCNCC